MSGLANEATHVRFTLLGPLTVRNDTGTVALGGARARCLLAALLLNAGRVTSIEALIDAAWEHPPAGARVLVQNRISVLRRTLRDAGLNPELIATVGSGYVFQAEEGMLDLDLFDRGVARAEELTSAAEAARELTAALALWHGPALDGLTTPPLAAAANQLAERRIRALKQRITLDLGLDRHTELVGELTGLVAEHPYQEDLRGLLMLALNRSGRQAEALRVYRDTRAVFTEQLGIEPSPSLSLLQDAILRDKRVSLSDLSGLPGVVDPDDRIRAAPAGPPVPRELPPPPASFTGRGEQLRLLDSLLVMKTDDSAAATITTIDGMAGVGKTALALHWAHRMADRFPDGQLHVDLRGCDRAPLRPIDALGRLLGALGAQVPADLDQAAALYRSLLAGRRMLVVLDNARSVEQVRPLLPGSPGSVVLITSRDRLSGLTAREGARRITLDVLEPAETYGFLALVIGADRMRAEPWATTVLAAMCGHLPLALRAAAARLTGDRYARVADLVAELRDGDRLTALAGGPDEPDPVRAALDPSYRRLPAPARRLLRLLSLVPGVDISAAAVASLSGLDPAAAESSLDQLAAAHLVEEHAPDRFRLHELVRHYATERAERFDDATERAAAVLRLLGWYLRHARAATATARFEVTVDAPFDGPAQAVRWLETEWGNLSAAVHHAPFWLARLLGDLLRGYLDATMRQSGKALWLPPSPRRPRREEQGRRALPAPRRRAPARAAAR